MINQSTWARYGATSLFVLLWGSGAIVSRLALNHGSPFAILALRFALAFSMLALFATAQRRALLPPTGARASVAVTGALLVGGYTICYFLALDNGITPGAIATILGVQPLLTLLIVERRFSHARIVGLLLAFVGLALVVLRSSADATLPLAGTLFALGALASVTAGAILQKRIAHAPQSVLPLQYAIAFVLCSLCLPFKQIHLEWRAELIFAVLWLALVISVIAQLLLYRLIHASNLVNVTSLFYLVPVVTAVMDYLFLGNLLPALGWLGMAAIIAGLALVFRSNREPLAQGRSLVKPDTRKS